MNQLLQVHRVVPGVHQHPQLPFRHSLAFTVFQHRFQVIVIFRCVTVPAPVAEILWGPQMGIIKAGDGAFALCINSHDVTLADGDCDLAQPKQLQFLQCHTGRASSRTWWTRRYRAARQLMAGDADSPPDHAAAFDLLTGEADAGNALAMADLGRMYAGGLGREPDPELAREWYAKVLVTFLQAEKEAPDRCVQYRIGKLYAGGLGTEQDYEEATWWLEKSANAGYKYAQHTLAGLYRDGKGVEQDYAAARELYAKAVTFPYAAYELGKLYRDGLGGEADEDRAARYFRQAFLGFQFLADRSLDDKLQYRIGWMLLHGVGTERDEAAALPWLEKAAAAGNQTAKYQLGKLLLTGADGGPRDTGRALELLTQCAEAGDQYAQYTLGKAYLLGQDIPQDQEQAVRWLKLSAEQGNQYAKFFLDRVYSSLFSSTASLLYHLGRIFQEQHQRPVAGIQAAVDSKLKRKIREKKIAMDHKPDDHEEQWPRM